MNLHTSDKKSQKSLRSLLSMYELLLKSVATTHIKNLLHKKIDVEK